MNTYRLPIVFRPIINLVRFASNSNLNSLDILHDFSPKFNSEEQEKLLRTFNECNHENLLNFDISKSKIKNLENYINKNGPFKNLGEILEVDGLGVKHLEKICEQIITENPNKTIRKTKINDTKKLRQFLTPALPITIANDLTSVVGIHLDPTGISWAKISRSKNELEKWNYKDLGQLPKKLLPTDNFNLAISLISDIPVGDVYIFEGNTSMNIQNQNQKNAVTSYNQQLELISMLLTLLNTDLDHNPDFSKKQIDLVYHKVYFLRYKLAARLFKTLVGNEKVSAITQINQLIDDNSANNQLPCTPITFETSIKNYYLSQSPASKELLGQALMLTIAFIDLCVIKNAASLKAVATRK